jgi:hypothetical protein
MRVLQAHGLATSLAVALVGCIPMKPDVERFETLSGIPEVLDPAGGVVLVGTTPEIEGLLRCVARRLETNARMQVSADGQYLRDAAFPWLEADVLPAKEAGRQRYLQDEVLLATLRSVGPRYVVWVSGSQWRSTPQAAPGVPASFTFKLSELKGVVLDVAEPRIVGDLSISAWGDDVYLFPYFFFSTNTFKVVCADFANGLAGAFRAVPDG